MKTLKLKEVITIAVKEAVPDSLQEVSEIVVTAIADNQVDTVKACITLNGIPRQIILWSNSNDKGYDLIGDYTQLQIDNRIIEIVESL